MVDLHEKLRVYNIVVGALIKCSEEACASCMCTENILVKLNKHLKKLKNDLTGVDLNEEKKLEYSAKIDKLQEIIEKLPIKADSDECLMTKGICKLPKCIAGNITGILSLAEG